MTIEQRATTIADELYKGNVPPYATTKLALARIADEQREIDIERAVEWLQENASDYIEAYFEYGHIYNDEKLVFDFEKAMKGE